MESYEMINTSDKRNLDEFKENCIRDYEIVPKASGDKKNRSFITNGRIPSQFIEITEVFEAKDNRDVKIITTQNGVKRRHFEIWGEASVVSIRKTKFRKSMFNRVMTPDETVVNSLLMQREELKILQHDLLTEIHGYQQALYPKSFQTYPPIFY